jgi:hypothetical protein
MKKTALITSLLFALPFVASAQQLTPVFNLINAVSVILNRLIPLLIALALVAFFYGLVRYIYKGSGENAAREGRQIMIAGLIALFVMVSVWGIIRLAQGALDVQGGGTIEAPGVPQTGVKCSNGQPPAPNGICPGGA